MELVMIQYEAKRIFGGGIWHSFRGEMTLQESYIVERVGGGSACHFADVLKLGRDAIRRMRWARTLKRPSSEPGRGVWSVLLQFIHLQGQSLFLHVRIRRRSSLWSYHRGGEVVLLVVYVSLRMLQRRRRIAKTGPISGLAA